MALPSQDRSRPLFPASTPTTTFCTCPPIGRLSSTLTRRLFYYVHRLLLKPISRWYCRRWNIQMDPVVHPLPFGFILKEKPRMREQEGLAMDLARAMGVPAPRFISYGEPPSGCVDGSASLLMTTIPGTLLSDVAEGSVDLDVVHDDLQKILSKMRRHLNPWDQRICSVDGGSVTGVFIPASPMPPLADESHFHQFIRDVAGSSMQDPAHEDSVIRAEKLFSLPPHAIVFTHGDLNDHNIMIGPDGHISGIIDWESAAWLPEYWEFAVTALVRRRPWGQVMDKEISGGVYAEQIDYNRGVFNLTSKSFGW
ncbi:hypothetical protein D9619_011899 [Psilocybe cf. subviscida]|uniref:Aminoglycoside phosphotransferase domain-containing protein n=1 Tax=Psilocybe cf. subviscida TaxID=2480587 RepID=A0A8H5EVY9_9AGAR|nr:hypothetical protein D9619_011899 [Psilocybe cf. subviscida]